MIANSFPSENDFVFDIIDLEGWARLTLGNWDLKAGPSHEWQGLQEFEPSLDASQSMR